jgi:hypothetical protein
MGDSFEPECQGDANWSQQLAAESTSTFTSQPFNVLGHGRLSAIEWTLIIDKETHEQFLHINQLPDDGSKHAIFFQGLGFSQDELCLPFTDVISKIQQHTEGKTDTPITQLRYLHYSNHSLHINL